MFGFGGGTGFGKESDRISFCPDLGSDFGGGIGFEKGPSFGVGVGFDEERTGGTGFCPDS